MEYYNWILTFHIMSFISWMAMLFYLPRLFVYHAENIENIEFVRIAKIQEYKLYKYIGVPALWATVISGLSMITLNPELFSTGGWLHVKLTVAVLLIAYSYSLGYYRKVLEDDKCTKSGVFFRVYNEVPTILALIIVIMVINKPF